VIVVRVLVRDRVRVGVSVWARDRIRGVRVRVSGKVRPQLRQPGGILFLFVFERLLYLELGLGLGLGL
jgi:hypothetical protein